MKHSGSVSIQLLQKENETTSLIKSIGSVIEQSDNAISLANALQAGKAKQKAWHFSQQNSVILALFPNFSIDNSQTLNQSWFLAGFTITSVIVSDKDLFRHLFIARLVFPLIKSTNIEYLYRFQAFMFNLDNVFTGF